MTIGAPRARAAFHTLTVADVEPLCGGAVAVTFAVPDVLATDYVFKPGQSLTVRRMIDGREQRRTYSICAPAGALPRIGVREIPDGLFSHWLVNDVKVGDSVEVQTPRGSFAADADVAARHMMIAAGSGITPILSIVTSVLANPDAHATLFYGNRTTNSVMFAEHLSDLKDRHGPRFDLFHVLSREPRGVELLSGRLDADRLRALLMAFVPIEAVDHFWLCGPFAMTGQARHVLSELGVPAARIHVELFYVDEPPPELRRAEAVQEDATADVTIVLDGRSSTTPLSMNVPILDAAQAVRSDLPYACKGGVCGTCRAMVLAGEVDMRRNYALEQDEVEAGFVLTCQSYPCSEALTLDYDR